MLMVICLRELPFFEHTNADKNIGFVHVLFVIEATWVRARIEGKVGLEGSLAEERLNVRRSESDAFVQA